MHLLFEKVNLGLYEKATRQWLTDDAADPPQIFDVDLSKRILTSTERLNDTWLLDSPPERWDAGVNAYSVSWSRSGLH